MRNIRFMTAIYGLAQRRRRGRAAAGQQPQQPRKGAALKRLRPIGAFSANCFSRINKSPIHETANKVEPSASTLTSIADGREEAATTMISFRTTFHPSDRSSASFLLLLLLLLCGAKRDLRGMISSPKYSRDGEIERPCHSRAMTTTTTPQLLARQNDDDGCAARNHARPPVKDRRTNSCLMARAMTMIRTRRHQSHGRSSSRAPLPRRTALVRRRKCGMSSNESCQATFGSHFHCRRWGANGDEFNKQPKQRLRSHFKVLLCARGESLQTVRRGRSGE